jgi:hypothetical protein
MAVVVQTFQASLPIFLFDRLQQLRRRYAKALQAAAAGDFSPDSQLRSVSRAIGHLLAEEAKKPPAERGGLRMLDISLEVDSFFPELRGWNQHVLLQLHRRRLEARARQERAS